MTPGNTLKVFQWMKRTNIGDTLPTPILAHFLNVKVVPVNSSYRGKWLVIGSELHSAQPGDTVWGQGIRKTTRVRVNGVKVLALRGRLSPRYVTGFHDPGVYGDPALLMPLIYKPEIEKKRKVGIIPHWSDAGNHPPGYAIHVTLPWREFIDEILACERVISSSLHGIVLAEAYGVPARWEAWGEGIKRQRIKFEDYLTGTDRKIQPPGAFPPIPDLGAIQRRLIKALMNYVRPQSDIPDSF